jgi:cell division protein FtsW
MTSKGRIDRVLFTTILVMASAGLVMVYSASSLVAELRYHQDSYRFIARQMIAAAIAVAALKATALADYQKLRSPVWAFLGLGLAIFTLIAAWFLDPGSHRWIPLYVTRLQPSEFAKPALIVFLAWFVTQKQEINSRYAVFPVALAVGVLCSAVVVADLGTAVVLVVTTGAILFLAGLNKRNVAIASVSGFVLLIGAIASKPHRVKRIIDFIDPKHVYLTMTQWGKELVTWAEAHAPIKDTGHQALQSKIAIGAGGITGQGLMQSKQKLLFLPEAHTDFIYAIIAEETGLIGSVLLLIGFMVIMWRGYRLYWTATDDFGKYIAAGVTTSIVFQALMNMSVVLDIGPTKGIPLPLISYGGSSLLATMISLGLLLSVSERANAERSV